MIFYRAVLYFLPNCFEKIQKCRYIGALPNFSVAFHEKNFSVHVADYSTAPTIATIHEKHDTNRYLKRSKHPIEDSYGAQDLARTFLKLPKYTIWSKSYLRALFQNFCSFFFSVLRWIAYIRLTITTQPFRLRCRYFCRCLFLLSPSL